MNSVMFPYSLTTTISNIDRYYTEVLHALEFSFSPLVVLEDRMSSLIRSSLTEMHNEVTQVLQDKSIELHNIRHRLNIDKFPFQFAKRSLFRIDELPKDDERRLVLQALFLFILRPNITLKYDSIPSFIKSYPKFQLRDVCEQDLLRVTANWIDLALLTTVSPKVKHTNSLPML